MNSQADKCNCQNCRDAEEAVNEAVKMVQKMFFIYAADRMPDKRQLEQSVTDFIVKYNLKRI